METPRWFSSRLKSETASHPPITPFPTWFHRYHFSPAPWDSVWGSPCRSPPAIVARPAAASPTDGSCAGSTPPLQGRGLGLLWNYPGRNIMEIWRTAATSTSPEGATTKLQWDAKMNEYTTKTSVAGGLVYIISGGRDKSDKSPQLAQSENSIESEKIIWGFP